MSFPRRRESLSMDKNYYVYIVTNKKYGVLYIGVTNNLVRRVYEHKHSIIEGFTKRYNINKLVYFEVYDEIEEAILREKRLKKWNRQWKINLIENENSNWDDLYNQLI